MTVGKSVAAGTAGAVIAAAVAFTPTWEGMDKVARRDPVGTGHPVTYCYGQTDEFGAVKVGTKFNKKQCDAKLAESLPTYLKQIGLCVKNPVPVLVMTALLDGAYNAGSSRVCHSPMVADINAGNIKAGCNAFHGWIVTGNHQVLKGLIDRRAGEDYGDPRESEKGLCLQGLSEQPNQDAWYRFNPSEPIQIATAAPAPAPVTKAWWQK